MYPTNSILKKVHTEFVNTYKANIKIEIVELDCEIDKLDNFLRMSNKNRYCVMIDDKFINLHEDLENAIKIIGWDAIGFCSKAECLSKIEKIKSDIEYHWKHQDIEDRRKVEGKFIFENKRKNSISRMFKQHWGIKI